MSREFIFYGVQLPTLLPLFLACIAMLLLVNAVFGWFGLYRRLWHPELVRLCLFTAIFGGAIIWFYQP